MLIIKEIICQNAEGTKMQIQHRPVWDNCGHLIIFLSEIHSVAGLFCLETGSPVTQAGLGLCIQPRVILIS